MLKFGELIAADVPVFIHFYAQLNENSDLMESVIQDLAAVSADYLRIVKIDVNKNPELVEALRIKIYPTMMLYRNDTMIWRQSGIMDLNALINVTKTL